MIQTLVLYVDKNLRSLEVTVNKELTSVWNWLMANKLSLNPKKSNFVFFLPYQKRMNFEVAIKLFDHDKNSLILLERTDYLPWCSYRFKPHLEATYTIYLLKDQQISWNYFKIETLCSHWYLTKHASVFDSALHNLWYCCMGPSCSNRPGQISNLAKTCSVFNTLCSIQISCDPTIYSL